MVSIVDRMTKVETDLYGTDGEGGMKAQIKTNTIWITKTTVKLNILFGVLTFMCITIGGLAITFIFELLTHKITIGF